MYIFCGVPSQSVFGHRQQQSSIKEPEVILHIYISAVELGEAVVDEAERKKVTLETLPLFYCPMIFIIFDFVFSGAFFFLMASVFHGALSALRRYLGRMLNVAWEGLVVVQ